MTKLRRNHTKPQNGNQSLIRMVLFAIVLLALLYMLYRMVSVSADANQEQQQEGLVIHDPKETSFSDDQHSVSKGCEVIKHKYYTISYCEDHESSEWVSYQLTQKQLQAPNVRRAKRFEMDPLIDTESAHHGDYTRSGYTRGHLAPAGDMAFDNEAMAESFFMSNMSPQIRPFNNGIWKELEEQFRDWVYQNNRLKMVTGPVLKDDNLKQIGRRNKVSVPKRFYKVILDDQGRKKKGIAFVIPHEKSDKPLQDFAMSIDEAEKITGIDFFAKHGDPSLVDRLEASYDINQWKISDARYKLRVERWNDQ